MFTTPIHHDLAPTSSFDRSSYFKQLSNEPLYTEINIPLPSIALGCPAQTPAASSPLKGCHSRSRARSFSSFSPFRTHSSGRTSDESARRSEDWPCMRKEIVKNRKAAAAMNLSHGNKNGRNGTIDALAIVPALLVLSAELFTPRTGDAKEELRKDSGVGRWENRIR